MTKPISKITLSVSSLVALDVQTAILKVTWLGWVNRDQVWMEEQISSMGSTEPEAGLFVSSVFITGT